MSRRVTGGSGELSSSLRLTSVTAALVASLALMASGNVPADDPAPEDPFLTARRARQEAASKIRQTVYSAKVSIDFKDTPLAEAVKTLTGKAGLKNVRLDETALMEEGVATDEPINRAVADVTLAAALHLTLEPHGLTWLVEDEMLVVTTQVKADEKLVSKFHDVRELRPAFAEASRTQASRSRQRFGSPAPSDPAGDYPEDVRDLVSLVMSETSGPWQDVDGTGGALTPLGASLIVRQSERVQEEVADLLRNLKKFVKGPPSLSVLELHLDEQAAAAERKQWAALAKTIGPLEFAQTPLRDVAKKLAGLSGATIIIDETALMEEGVAIDEPITFTSGPITLRSALAAIFDSLGLTVILEDEVVKLTTKVKADEKLTTRLYDLRDVVKAGVDMEALAGVLEAESSGPWEEIDGTGGTLTVPLPGAIVVRQTLKVHEELMDLLGEVRAGLKPGDKPAATVKGKPVDGSLVVRFYALDRKGLGAQMEKAVPEFVAPESWETNGGKGTVRRVDETLIVRQTASVHRRIREFLADFKSAEDAPVLASPLPGRFRGF